MASRFNDDILVRLQHWTGDEDKVDQALRLLGMVSGRPPIIEDAARYILYLRKRLFLADKALRRARTEVNRGSETANLIDKYERAAVGEHLCEDCGLYPVTAKDPRSQRCIECLAQNTGKPAFP